MLCRRFRAFRRRQRRLLRAVLAALLGEDAHARSALGEHPQHRLLRGAVGVGDEVDAALQVDVARLVVHLAQDPGARLRRGETDLAELAAHASALSSLSCSPPKAPLDMASTTSPLRSSLISAATMASGDSIQRAGVPDRAMSSAILRASTRSASGTLAMAVGWLMIASAAPLNACPYSSWWILRMAVLLRGSKTATRRRPGYCAATAAMVSRTAVGWWAKSSMMAMPFTSPRSSCRRLTPRKLWKPAAISSGLRPSARQLA